MDVTPDDLPPCACRNACIDTGSMVITNFCPLHNPVDGLLVEQPVQFTGLLSVLDAGKLR